MVDLPPIIKAPFLLTPSRSGAKRIPMGLVFAFAVIFLHQNAAAISPVNLGTASNFSVLAGAGITVTATSNSTTVTGDIGTFPTTTITGIGNMIFSNGVNHAGDAVTQNAKLDLVTAYSNAIGRAATTNYSPAFDLGGLTLTNGVYNDSTSLAITGNLTLDAAGDPNAVWIFQAGSTLGTATSSQILLTNGAQACNVFWTVGTAASLGAGSQFAGTILALSAITLGNGAVVDGRVLSQNGALNLDSNTIIIPANVPEPVSTLLFGAGLATLFALRRRF